MKQELTGPGYLPFVENKRLVGLRIMIDCRDVNYYLQRFQAFNAVRNTGSGLYVLGEICRIDYKEKKWYKI